MNDRNPVTEPLGFFHVMSRKKDREPGSSLGGEYFPETSACFGIQPGSRFIKNQEPGLINQSARNLQSPAHPTRKRFDQLPLFLDKTELIEKEQRPFFRFFLSDTEKTPELDQLINGIEIRIERLFLRTYAEALPRLSGILMHVDPQDPDSSR